jgi:HPt (histidine-containing phosphotransfer) domain-containing protein
MDVLTSLEDAQPEEGSDLVVELIDLYLIEAARLMLAVHQAFDKKDQLSIRRAAHNLRGSSSSLGVRQMALICDEVERTEFNDRFPIAAEVLSSMQDEFERARLVLLAERQRRLA